MEYISVEMIHIHEADVVTKKKIAPPPHPRHGASTNPPFNNTIMIMIHFYAQDPPLNPTPSS